MVSEPRFGAAHLISTAENNQKVEKAIGNKAEGIDQHGSMLTEGNRAWEERLDSMFDRMFQKIEEVVKRVYESDQLSQYPPQQWMVLPQYSAPPSNGTDEGRTLWIGDLQYWMDENYLNTCFYQTGELLSAKVIRNEQTGQSEGYGFLEFRTRAIAENIMQTYNGTTMPNAKQTYGLKWATRGAEERRTDGSPEHTIFVGDLDDDDEGVVGGIVEEMKLLSDEGEVSSRYGEHSEGEESMYGCVSDDERRVGLYYGKNVVSRDGESGERESQLVLNSAVAFGNDDWDDFVQGSGEDANGLMGWGEIMRERQISGQSGVGSLSFTAAASSVTHLEDVLEESGVESEDDDDDVDDQEYLAPVEKSREDYSIRGQDDSYMSENSSSTMAKTYDNKSQNAQEEKQTVGYLSEASNKVSSVEEMVAMMLKFAAGLAETHARTPVKDVVITVPPFTGVAEQREMLAAADLAGLNVLALVNEHSGAALQYGIDKDFANGSRHVVFYDKGASSTYAALVYFSAYKTKEVEKTVSVNQFEVKDVKWDAEIGGQSREMRLVEYFADEFNKQLGTGFDIRNSPKAIAKLKKQVKRTTEILSANVMAPISVESLYDDRDFRSTISREKFEELCADLGEKALVPLKEVLKDSGLKADDLYGVELIGGATRVPKLQAKLQEFLGRKELDKHLDADEAIVLGASLYAANLSDGIKLNRELGMIDGYTYGFMMEVGLVRMVFDPGGKFSNPYQSIARVTSLRTSSK